MACTVYLPPWIQTGLRGEKLDAPDAVTALNEMFVAWQAK